MKRCAFLVASIVLLAATSPALAEEWWVAQDPAAKTCKVVEEMPDGKTKVMIGATSYPTKDEAKAAKKVAQKSGVCVEVDSKKPKTEAN
jgi:hypothetical protein